jgi:hypothetical protein
MLALLLALFGSFLAIASLNVAIERFTVTHVPIMYVMLLLVAAQLWRWLKNRQTISYLS